MNIVEKKPPPLRRVAFGVLAAFILLAPAVPQVLGVSAPVFRPWIMYSGVGLGLLRGEFVVTRAVRVEVMTPEAFLDLHYYPRSMSLDDPHVVLSEAELVTRMEAFCRAEAGVEGIAFKGELSVLKGWRPLSAAVSCAQ